MMRGASIDQFWVVRFWVFARLEIGRPETRVPLDVLGDGKNRAIWPFPAKL